MRTKNRMCAHKKPYVCAQKTENKNKQKQRESIPETGLIEEDLHFPVLKFKIQVSSIRYALRPK